MNDDYTPMEFVVGVLTMFFNKTIDEADVLTQRYIKMVKVLLVSTHLKSQKQNLDTMKLARKEEHPLSIKLESE